VRPHVNSLHGEFVAPGSSIRENGSRTDRTHGFEKLYVCKRYHQSGKFTRLQDVYSEIAHASPKPSYVDVPNQSGVSEARHDKELLRTSSQFINDDEGIQSSGLAMFSELRQGGGYEHRNLREGWLQSRASRP